MYGRFRAGTTIGPEKRAAVGLPCGIESEVDIVAHNLSGTLAGDLTSPRRVLPRGALARRRLPALELAAFLEQHCTPTREVFAGLDVREAELVCVEGARNTASASERTLPMIGVGSTLRQLTGGGIEIGAVSAAPVERLERDLATLFLGAGFESLAGSATLKRNALCEPAARRRGRVVCVGDPERDVTEALATGADPLGFAGGHRPRGAPLSAGAARGVEDLREVPAAVRVESPQAVRP